MFSLAVLSIGCGSSASAPTKSEPTIVSVEEEQPFAPARESVEGEDDGVLPNLSAKVPPAEAPPTKANAAELLVGEAARQLAAMKITAYQHTTEIDEATGTFKYDCSGFLRYALLRSSPAHFDAVVAFGGVKRPLAKDYELFFESLSEKAVGGWSRVVLAGDLRPGDVVAWRHPPDSGKTTTGHVVIVREAAYVNPRRADEVIVPVIDSAVSFHGATDSRYPSGGGLGAGPIGLILDSTGRPVRYRWTGGVSATEVTTEISMGRPE